MGMLPSLYSYVTKTIDKHRKSKLAAKALERRRKASKAKKKEEGQTQRNSPEPAGGSAPAARLSGAVNAGAGTASAPSDESPVKSVKVARASSGTGGKKGRRRAKRGSSITADVETGAGADKASAVVEDWLTIDPNTIVEDWDPELYIWVKKTVAQKRLDKQAAKAAVKSTAVPPESPTIEPNTKLTTVDAVGASAASQGETGESTTGVETCATTEPARKIATVQASSAGSKEASRLTSVQPDSPDDGPGPACVASKTPTRHDGIKSAQAGPATAAKTSTGRAAGGAVVTPTDPASRTVLVTSMIVVDEGGFKSGNAARPTMAGITGAVQVAETSSKARTKAPVAAGLGTASETSSSSAGAPKSHPGFARIAAGSSSTYKHKRSANVKISGGSGSMAGMAGSRSGPWADSSGDRPAVTTFEHEAAGGLSSTSSSDQLSQTQARALGKTSAISALSHDTKTSPMQKPPKARRKKSNKNSRSSIDLHRTVDQPATKAETASLTAKKPTAVQAGALPMSQDKSVATTASPLPASPKVVRAEITVTPAVVAAGSDAKAASPKIPAYVVPQGSPVVDAGPNRLATPRQGPEAQDSVSPHMLQQQLPPMGMPVQVTPLHIQAQGHPSSSHASPLQNQIGDPHGTMAGVPISMMHQMPPMDSGMMLPPNMYLIKRSFFLFCCALVHLCNRAVSCLRRMGYTRV